MAKYYENDDYKVEKMSSLWIKVLAVFFWIILIISAVFSVINIIQNKEMYMKVLNYQDATMVIVIAAVAYLISFIILFLLIFALYRIGELTDERNVLKEEISQLREEVDSLNNKMDIDRIKHKYE